MFKRALAMVALASVFCLGFAQAGEKAEKVAFVEGVFSVTIPAGWSYEQDENGLTNVTDDDESGNFLIFVPPNPALKNDKAAEFAGMLLGLMFKDKGKLEVREEEATKFKKFDSTNALYALKDAGGNVVVAGLINVVVMNDSTVIMITGAPAANAEEFLPKAAEVMESYEINLEQLAAKKDVLIKIGKELVEEIAEAAE